MSVQPTLQSTEVGLFTIEEGSAVHVALSQLRIEYFDDQTIDLGARIEEAKHNALADLTKSVTNGSFKFDSREHINRFRHLKVELREIQKGKLKRLSVLQITAELALRSNVFANKQEKSSLQQIFKMATSRMKTTESNYLEKRTEMNLFFEKIIDFHERTGRLESGKESIDAFSKVTAHSASCI